MQCKDGKSSLGQAPGRLPWDRPETCILFDLKVGITQFLTHFRSSTLVASPAASEIQVVSKLPPHGEI